MRLRLLVTSVLLLAACEGVVEDINEPPLEDAGAGGGDAGGVGGGEGGGATGGGGSATGGGG
ncbi:MAG: hypothetical protein AB1938_31225, partial [Myxococcota bacterium]